MNFSGPLHEKSYLFALEIIRICRMLMDEKREFILSKQLMRSATSIGANIEEGQQPQSLNDFISKLSIALKEANESRYWIRLLRDSKYINVEWSEALILQSEEIISMLVRSIKTAKQNRC